MKLMIVIVNKDDAGDVTAALRKDSYPFTKIATSGGFLQKSNCTLFLGVEDDQVQGAIDIIKENSSRRTEMISSPLFIEAGNMAMTQPIPVEVGGAIVFVCDVERFEKV